MSCPVEWRLAAAASGADDDAFAHTAVCERCRALVADQRATSELARRLRPPVLSPSARAEIAVAVMAGTIPQPQGRRGVAVMGATVVLAAAIALLVRGPRTVREQQAPGDEARITAPVAATAPGPEVSIASGRAEVTAQDGVIVETHVLAGSAVVSDAGKSVVVHAGHVWKREAPAPSPPPPPPAPPQPATSLAAFREGWTARDEGRNADAVAAFDRATDPVVAEEAMFWAAVCAGRAGDVRDSARRMSAFLDRFPNSLRAKDARRALEAP